MLVEKNDVEQKLAKSLSAESANLLPFLPYLLQDLWELGSSPAHVIKLMQRNFHDVKKMRLLDLACGKGAVAVMLAKTLEVEVKGVDILPEFIDCAERKAFELGVASYCSFLVGDINKTVLDEKDYDCVILGAVGDVLGDPKETLIKLKKTVKADGCIIYDDVYAYSEDKAQFSSKNYEYLTYDQWQRVFEETGLKVVDCITGSVDNEQNESNTQSIITRAIELIQLYPEHKHLFEDYIESQKEECDDLENNLVGITWLLKNRRDEK